MRGAGHGDLGSFTGWERSDPRYKAMVTTIQDATLKVGKKVGAPLAWYGRDGFSFFQGPSEGRLIRSGVQLTLAPAQDPGGEQDGDVATGDEPR